MNAAVERQADTTNQQGVLTHNGRPSRITTIYCRSKAMTSNQYTVCLQVVPIITNVLTIVHYLWYTVQQFIGMYVCGEWIQISEDIKHSTTHTSTENVNLHWTVISLLVFVVYYYSIPKFVTNTIH